MGQALSRESVLVPLQLGKEALENVDVRYVSQGFSNGLLLYCVTPLVSSSLKRRRVKGSVWRTSVAAGTFIGGFRFFREFILALLRASDKRLEGTDSASSKGTRTEPSVAVLGLVRRYRDFIAGALAASLGLAVDDKFLGSFLVSWWTLRAVRCFLPAWKLGSTVVMCAAAAVINPASFLFKNEVQPAYGRFMESMTLGINRSTLLHDPVPANIAKKSLHGWDRWVYCDELHRDAGAHPTSSCTHAVVSWVMPRVFLISLKMYAPLYLAWEIIRLRFPGSRYVQNTLRSSVFLTLYTITQYLLVMWRQSMVEPTITRAQHASLAWASGLWTLVERPERRTELATYCASHALNSLWLTFRKGGTFQERNDRLKIAYPLVILSSAVLSHCQDQHSGFVRSLFGFDGP